MDMGELYKPSVTQNQRIAASFWGGRGIVFHVQFSVAVRALLLLLPLVVLVQSAIAGEEEPEELSCVECHQKKKPFIDEKVLLESVHKDLDCEECHPAAEMVPHPQPLKKVNCNICHTKESKAFQQGIHAKLALEGAKDLPLCKDCHGTHNIFKGTDIRSTTNHFQIDATCIKCHASLEVTARHSDMPKPSKVKAFLKSAHGTGLHGKGLLVSATCTDCHGHHEIRPKKNPDSPINRNNVPLTCKKCHLGIFTEFEQSAHGAHWKKHLANGGSKKEQEKGKGTGLQKVGPVCSTCHHPHEINVTDSFQNGMVGECGNCHHDKVLTYKDTFHGKATDLGFKFAAKCSDCHTPHHNLGADDPRSSIHPKNIVKTCRTCHPGANQSFVAYRPHLNLEDPSESPLVYYVHLFMKWLLFCVFTFFGVHTALWLQRSLVAWMRGEIQRPSQDGPYVRRFAKESVVLHILMVVSFLGLVATGLPLKYHSSAWAREISPLLGGLAVMRYFHRLCGLVMLGFFLWHVGQLFRRILIQRRFDLLLGPVTMIPRFKDLADFFCNLRWFLYAGPRPRYDRWTYFEKFDYFAVFWGVPILGLSGLLMWFPAFFSKYVSGLAFNLATVIHSEEALLAAAFIFTFHFYHNHFRVENFPMDVSIFTGRMSLERFREERPEEYARLVREDRLKDVLVEAPDAALLRKSKIFGFAALGAGTLLIGVILFTYFFGG